MTRRILARLSCGWRRCFLAALVAILPLAASAQPAPDWTVRTAATAAAMIALDRSNNTYVAGWVPGSTAMTLAKISPAGATLWQRSFDNPGTILQSTWVSVDAAGNAVVSGRIVGSAGAAAGIVVLKVDAAGNLLWQDLIPAAGGYAARVETDAVGNAHVLALLPNAGATALELAVIKYDPAGARLWSRNIAGSNVFEADALVITASGRVIVSGRSGSQIVAAAVDAAGNAIWANATNGVDASDVAVGPAGEFYVVGGAATGAGYLVVKRDASFNELWRNTYPARGAARRALVDSAGNLVVTGATDTNTGNLTVVLYDWMTIKIAPNGALLWSRIDADNDAEIPNAMALGADDSIYITGEGRAAIVDPAGTFLGPSTLTHKHAPDGTLLWATNAAAASVQEPSLLRGIGVRVGSEGGVFVVGRLPQTVFRYPQNGLPNQPPQALAKASTITGFAPLTVSFSSLGSNDPDGMIAAYAWDFGDGQGSTAANPAHTYAAGTYTALLTVTDTLGAAATSAPIVITVSAGPPPPVPTALSLSKYVVSKESKLTATVTVSTKAGVVLALASSNSAVASVPPTLTIPAGSTTATFTVRTSNVRRDTVVTLSARANGATAAAALTVRAK